jgi:hypothetical protein
MIEDGVKDMPLFEWTENSVTLTGKAFPENSALAWSEFINELIEYFDKQEEKINREEFFVNFILDYYNSSSAVFISKMFEILQQNSKKRNCVVNWYYFDADDGGLEDGETYRDSSLYKKVKVYLILRED